jgi:predicted DNA-binding transcriptional regulator AlpA
MLGVTQQRVHQLVGRKDFPPPIAELAIGQVWDRTAIQEWARATGRLDDPPS